MRIRALMLMAAGVLLVALDFRIVALDVLPDAVGWALVAVGAWRLALRTPALLGMVAAVASAADAVAPHHFDALDPLTGKVVPDPAPGTRYPERLAFDRLTDARLVLVVLAMVAGGLALWMVLDTLGRRAGAVRDAQSERQLRILRWLVALGWVVPFVVVAGVQGARDGGLDPVWNGSLEFVALIGVLVAALLAWVLAVNSNRMWTATDDERATPWAEMIATDR
jgi:hypothetical protein